ncbi:MAG TPA: RDD family protein [Arachnia sp.]|nr:RDD family protein [Arachnia sp.]HMT86064.1 RDD family protein [Arachnia sp.]
MSYTAAPPPAGWYPDPAGSGGERFWDGTAWSQATRDAQPAPPPEPPPAPAHPYSYPQGQQAPPHPQAPMGQPAPYDPHYQPHYQIPGQRLVAAQGGRPLARFGRRLGAWVLDYLLTFIMVMVTTSNLSLRVAQGLEIYMTNILVVLEDPSAEIPPIPPSLLQDYFLLFAAIAAIHVAYRILINGFLGSTLGEKLLKLKVARLGDESLAKIGWSAAVLRGLFSGVFVAMGFIIGILDLMFAGFTKRKQAIHDMVAKSVVYEL